MPLKLRLGSGPANVVQHASDKRFNAPANKSDDGFTVERSSGFLSQHLVRGGLKVANTVDKCAVEVEYDRAHSGIPAVCRVVSDRGGLGNRKGQPRRRVKPIIKPGRKR